MWCKHWLMGQTQSTVCIWCLKCTYGLIRVQKHHWLRLDPSLHFYQKFIFIQHIRIYSEECKSMRSKQEDWTPLTFIVWTWKKSSMLHRTKKNKGLKRHFSIFTFIWIFKMLKNWCLKCMWTKRCVQRSNLNRTITGPNYCRILLQPPVRGLQIDLFRSRSHCQTMVIWQK